MKVKVGGYVLYLGRPRSDGYRNVERVRLTNWRALLPSLRRAKMRSRMDENRLYVQTESPGQLKFSFAREAAG